MAEYAASRRDLRRAQGLYSATGKSLPIFGERIETPFGPAAGPNTQLAQNIIAAYVAGARFFELKTVQKMDGAELAACVPRPCILANDEGYNQEWSTELTVPQAMDEYIKAWCALKVLSKQSTASAIPTASCSTCPWATTWRASRAKRSTPISSGMKDAIQDRHRSASARPP